MQIWKYNIVNYTIKTTELSIILPTIGITIIVVRFTKKLWYFYCNLNSTLKFLL